MSVDVVVKTTFVVGSKNFLPHPVPVNEKGGRRRPPLPANVPRRLLRLVDHEVGALTVAPKTNEHLRARLHDLLDDFSVQRVLSALGSVIGFRHRAGANVCKPVAETESES